MRRVRFNLIPALMAISVLMLPAAGFGQGLGDMTDEEILATMHAWNEELSAMGLDIAIEQIEFFTIGQSRPPVKIHQQPFRWVAGDPRRVAQGDDITYLIDDINGVGPTSLGGVFPVSEFQSAKIPIFNN